MEELVEPTQPEYTSDIEKFVICVDTMGQDRQISDESKEYLEQFCKKLSENWETTSVSILKRDVLAFIEYRNEVKELE